MTGKAVWIAAAWVLGYGIEIYFELNNVNYVASGMALLLILLAYVLRLPWRNGVSVVLLIIAAMGYFHSYDAANMSQLSVQSADWQEVNGIEVVVQGMIVSPVKIDGDRVSFTLVADRITADLGETRELQEQMQVTIRLQQQSEQELARHWKRGDLLVLRSTLQQPSPARNFDGFDYRRYLRQQRIHWLLTSKGMDSVQHQPGTFQFSSVQLLRFTDDLRGMLSERIDQVFPAASASFMKGILIGIRDDLDPERFNQFSALGLTHIIAISGLHVSVLLGVIIWLLKRLRLNRETYLLMAICFLPPYILLTGAAPSIIRAGLMAMIGLWALRSRWRKSTMNVLCVVGVILLLWRPYYIFDVSFQLSFIVTACLIWGVPRLSSLLTMVKPWLAGTLSVTVVSQLASFPLSIYYFNQFSLLSPIANMLLIPVFSMIVYPIGLLALAAGFIWEPIGIVIGTIVGWVNTAAFMAIEGMERWKGQLIWPSPSLLWIGLYYILLLVIYRFVHLIIAYRRSSEPGIVVLTRGAVSHYRLLAQAGLALALFSFTLLLFVGYTPDRWNRYGAVQFLDVGQGDAILIRTPTGKHLLVDGGGSVRFRKSGEEWRDRKDPYEIGRKLLVPLLKKRGVHHLDYVFLTHQDMDHAGGLQAVVQDIPIRRFIFNGTLRQTPENEKLFQLILDRSIPLYAAEQGQIYEIDPYTRIIILYPKERTHIEIQNDQNESSIVFVLEMLGKTWLFTGDIGHQTETILMSYPADDWIPVDVLKVAHHGSKNSTSEAWLEKWKPVSSVISAGVNNIYRHPAAATLERLDSAGTRIFRTDLMGEVQSIVQDGRWIWRIKLMETS